MRTMSDQGVMMKCYARWSKSQVDGKEFFFRDQTIIQFGDSWNLVANLILLNPGSAEPMNFMIQDDLLKSKELPFYILPEENRHYYEFSLDPLMRNMIRCFSKMHQGGVIKIYNLFNLKNPASHDARNEYKLYRHISHMHTPANEVKYGNAQVIIGSGSGGNQDGLKDELKKLIALANPENLYSISKIDTKLFGIIKSIWDDNELIQSYHPSYTCAYGNRLKCE